MKLFILVALCFCMRLDAVEVRSFPAVPAEPHKRYTAHIRATFTELLPGVAADLQLAALDASGKELQRYQNPIRFQLQFVTNLAREFSVSSGVLPAGTRQLRAEFCVGGNPAKFQCGNLRIEPYQTPTYFKGVYPPTPPAPDRAATLERLRKIKPLHAEVRSIHGDPALFFDGKMVPYAAYSGDRDYKQFADSGANLVIAVKGSQLYWSVPWDAAAMTGPGRFDFTRLENELLRIHAADPRLKVIVSVNCNPDDAWLEKHPGSIFTAEDGRRGNAKHCGFAGFGLKPDHKKQIYYAVSYASEEYQNYAVAGLKALAEFLKKSPAGNIVAGFRIAGGHDGQFVQWHYSAEIQGHLDYSAGHLAAFRKYLREKYKTDQALRKAWEEHTVTFDTAELFTRKEFKSRPYFAPGDGPGQKIADCREFVSISTARMIRRFGRTLKDSFGRPCVIQTWYSSAIWQQTGRSSLDELAKNQDVDIVAMVTDYAPPRLPGAPGGAGNFAIGAAKLRHLLFVQELDHRTWTAQQIPGWNYTAYPADAGEFHAQAMRDAASVLTSGGYGFYWYDMFGSWYHHPEAQRVVKESFALQKRALQEIGKASRRAECAIFLDERARFRYEGGGGAAARKIWRLSGINYDVYHLNDLTDPALPEYKAYLLFSPLTITRDEVAALKKHARNKPILIAGESGFLSSDYGSAAALLAEFNLKIEDRLHPQYRVAEFVSSSDKLGGNLRGRTALVWGRVALNKKMVYPTQSRYSVITDPQATLLAVWQGTNEPAIAVKRTAENTIVYSGHNGGVSAQLLHNFARESGVSIWAEPGNVLLAGSGVAVFHRLTDSPGVIHFGRMVSCFEALSGKKVSTGSSASLPAAPMRTCAVVVE